MNVNYFFPDDSKGKHETLLSIYALQYLPNSRLDNTWIIHPGGCQFPQKLEAFFSSEFAWPS